MTTIVRNLDLDTLRLASGGHAEPDWDDYEYEFGSTDPYETGGANGKPPTIDLSGQACLLEVCSFMAGEPWSDRPNCVSYALGAFGRRLNDLLDDERRQRLVPLIPKMLNTAGDGLDEVRRHIAIDWAVRVGTPLWLDAAGRTDLATELRGLAPITDKAGRDAIRPRLREISDLAWKSRNEAMAKVKAVAKAAAERALANGTDPAVADADAVAAAVADAVADAVAAADADAVAAADAAADGAADAVAAADAAADAAAAAAAAADAVAAAVAAAAAAAAADAVAAAAAERYSDTWNATYDKVYADTKARILAKYGDVTGQVHDSAIECFTRMVEVKA